MSGSAIGTQRTRYVLYNPGLTHSAIATEGVSAIAESVEALFPGVERSTLCQIIENCFKPTNIYR